MSTAQFIFTGTPKGTFSSSSFFPLSLSLLLTLIDFFFFLLLLLSYLTTDRLTQPEFELKGHLEIMEQVIGTILVELPLLCGIIASIVIYSCRHRSKVKTAWLLHVTEIAFLAETALRSAFYRWYDSPPTFLLGVNGQIAVNWVYDTGEFFLASSAFGCVNSLQH